MPYDYLHVSSQERLYQEATERFGASLQRLVRAYEADPEKRRDLLQEIHLALWLSFEKFEARCSLRTWVYRIAHNTATSHVIRWHRANSQVLLSLEEIDAMAEAPNPHQVANERMALERLVGLIHRLKPLDRDIMLLYLEGLDTAAISEITGISAGYVRVQIHRIKAILRRQFHEGGLA